MFTNTDPFFPALEVKEEPVPIIIVVGEICSGKDTFAKQLVQHEQIDVGNIVREITQTKERVQNSDLDKAIVPILISRIKEHMPVVVTGIRQKSILDAIEAHFGSENFEYIYLSVKEEERLKRFILRDKKPDAQKLFKQYIAKDNQIGLAELIEHLLTNKAIVIKN